MRFVPLALCSLLLAFVPISNTSAADSPNIVLIMTDDQGYGDLGFHGNDKIDTPVLDRLASQSVRFDRFFVCPYCTPTRAALMTGRYPLRTGAAAVTRGLETVRSREVTIAEVLRSAGYATGCFGKWHIGEHYPSHPNGQGFDEFFGMPQGHWDNYFDPRLEHNGRMVQTRGFITDVITEYALRFIQQHHDSPFFCYVPYNAPHTPHQVPDRYFDKYIARGLDTRAAAIYGMVENIDENVGRLLAKLDELDLAERTVVFFLSDNGAEGPEGSRYNAGMRGMKGTVHEGGMRVPLFVRWPGKFEPGLVVKPIAAHVDLLPTIAELCGVNEPETLPLDGRSFVPLLTGQVDQWPDRMIFARTAGWRSVLSYNEPVVRDLHTLGKTVRTQRWRAVDTGEGWQLYDMANDPAQQRDVAGDHRDELARLAAAYDRWFADVTQTPIIRPPIPVGYNQRPTVELPAPEAYFTGAIQWYNRFGFAHDWLTGWIDPKDKVWWEIDVVAPGRYEVSIQYTCPVDAVGTKLRVETGGTSLEGEITRAYSPEPRLRPTRHPKKRFIQTFATQRLGEIQLDQGPQQITIRAQTKPADQVCDVKCLLLRRIEEENTCITQRICGTWVLQQVSSNGFAESARHQKGYLTRPAAGGNTDGSVGRTGHATEL
jgi:arylsulfatase A